jgi:hypothetical protein
VLGFDVELLEADEAFEVGQHERGLSRHAGNRRLNRGTSVSLSALTRVPPTADARRPPVDGPAHYPSNVFRVNHHVPPAQRLGVCARVPRLDAESPYTRRVFFPFSRSV